MMALMVQRLILFATAFAVPVLIGTNVPAQAQFYDLDGAYRCLMAPDQKCDKAETPLTPAPLPSAPPPSVAAVIAKIRASAVSADDIAVLEKETTAKEPHAVEALAWCALNGLGMAADPVRAFWLYEEAADLGIPTARANQVAVFETVLSPEQRQLVLMREQNR
jgi:TPR repeat protein